LSNIIINNFDVIGNLIMNLKVEPELES